MLVENFQVAGEKPSFLIRLKINLPKTKFSIYALIEKIIYCITVELFQPCGAMSMTLT